MAGSLFCFPDEMSLMKISWPIAMFTQAGLALVLLLTGCGPASHVENHVTTTAGEDPSVSPPATAPKIASTAGDVAAASSDSKHKAISLRVADANTLERVLRQQRGKVVLVDFWATWCIPCKKNLPRIVAFGDKHRDAGLVVISLSIDDLSSQEDALRFLKSVKAHDINLISKWGAGSESAERFDFSGEVPFYRLYDRTGKLRYEFSGNAESRTGVESVEQIEPRIQELLRQQAS